MSNCGCSPSSNTPPGSTTPSSAVPSNSYGGQTTLPTSGSCVNNSCPAPPTSEAEDIDTVCETWVEALRPRAFGRMLLKFGASCLYTLKSKCSGYLYYDATTENVSVDGQPPFVSSNPQTTAWGFLAKVITRQKTLCVDGIDVCAQEGRQELAAQIVEEVQCGQIALITRPKCGAVPLSDSADLDKQVGIHALNPNERTACNSALFLMRIENTANPTCPLWQVMRGIKLLQSDIGVATTQELASAKPPIWVRSGGTDENPCWALKVNNRSANNELPVNASSCQIAMFTGEEWEARDMGHAMYPVAASTEFSITTPYGQWTKTANMASAEDFPLPDKPSPRCEGGTVWAEIELWIDVSTGPSASSTTGAISIGGTNYVVVTSGTATRTRTIKLDVTSLTNLSLRLYRTAGSGSIRGSLNVLGYFVK